MQGKLFGSSQYSLLVVQLALKQISVSAPNVYHGQRQRRSAKRALRNDKNSISNTQLHSQFFIIQVIRNVTCEYPYFGRLTNNTKPRRGGGLLYYYISFSPESLPTGEEIVNRSTPDFEIYVTKPYQQDCLLLKEIWRAETL